MDQAFESHWLLFGSSSKVLFVGVFGFLLLFLELLLFAILWLKFRKVQREGRNLDKNVRAEILDVRRKIYGTDENIRSLKRSVGLLSKEFESLGRELSLVRSQVDRTGHEVRGLPKSQIDEGCQQLPPDATQEWGQGAGSVLTEAYFTNLYNRIGTENGEERFREQFRPKQIGVADIQKRANNPSITPTFEENRSGQYWAIDLAGDYLVYPKSGILLNSANRNSGGFDLVYDTNDQLTKSSNYIVSHVIRPAIFRQQETGIWIIHEKGSIQLSPYD